MKLKTSSLMKLAEMICGNEPFNYFPYRSSSLLTSFFMNVDLDYTHDGSTRSSWVQSVLIELNNKAEINNQMGSKEIISVIEHLLNPEYFHFDEDTDLVKARESVKLVLKINNLTISERSNGSVRVIPLHGDFISTEYAEVPHEKLVTFSPSVFKVPDKPQNKKLISVMMPFNAGFTKTYESIRKVAEHMGLDCKRADDIWDNSTIIQDIFDLIFCAEVVVVDFTGRNPNVMYETGIAHTLGKQVIPITQSIEDIPSDIGHHMALQYFPNEQGYKDLMNSLYKRFKIVFNQK